MQLWQYTLLVTARSLYVFRTLSGSIIRSTKNFSSNHWCMPWVKMIYRGDRVQLAHFSLLNVL
jgi:hypothetical protein